MEAFMHLQTAYDKGYNLQTDQCQQHRIKTEKLQCSRRRHLEARQELRDL